MMYICDKCGHIFECGEERTFIENYDCNSGSGEEYACCPLCGGNFSEAHACKRCNEYKRGVGYDDWCNSCKGEIWKKFKNVLTDNFSGEEIEIINECLDEGRQLQ